MTVGFLASGSTPRLTHSRASAGFSLIELMVAVTLLSILFLLAVPTYQKLQRKARTAAIVNDFQVFATALQAKAHEAGSWPPEAGPGVVPAGMTPEEIKFDDWSHVTPIGGHFDWENDQLHNGVRFRAAIAITDTTDAPLVFDYEQLLDIDRAIDDGDLTTGNFRLGVGNCPLFVIEN
jgi:prepilin-type N-terminal cleavage/methylation domain-containing protein